jgi:hypothetical protein
MPWGDVGLQLLAVLVYPGMLLTAIVGVLCEVGSGFLLDGRFGAWEALRRVLQVLRELPGEPIGLLAWLFASLAACGASVPLAPMASTDGSLLLSTLALATAIWLDRIVSPGGDGMGRQLLLGQLCWLVALFAPALASSSLRPQALGAVAVPILMPVKVLSGLLGLLCLPVLLGLLPESVAGGLLRVPWAWHAGRGGVGARLRMVLWLPACGLLISVEVPPPLPDPAGALRFFAMVLGVAMMAAGSVAIGRRVGQFPHLRLALPLAGLVVAVAVMAATLS